jgi:hypothetical protein
MLSGPDAGFERADGVGGVPQTAWPAQLGSSHKCTGTHADLPGTAWTVCRLAEWRI